MFALELAFVALLICINGLMAMSELAVVSSRPGRLKLMRDRGVNGAGRALKLASDPGKFLATVQTGITLVGVLSGAFSGATLGFRAADWLERMDVSPAAADILGVGLVVAGITYASLIVGEIVPKQIALRNPEGIAVRVAPAMTWLARIGSPVVWLLDLSGKAILSLLGQRAPSDAKVTDEEIKLLVAEAESAGVIEPGEREMIAGVMRLGDRTIRAVMTPRPEVDAIDIASDPATIRNALIASPHSRLPVYEGTPDEIVGIVQAKDLLNAYLLGGSEPPELRTFIRAAPIIPDTADALDVVTRLKASPVHIGLVYDEYGVFEGLVTTADILEAIVGVFQTEEGPAEPGIVRREDGTYLVSGSLSADELAELVGIAAEDRPYQTTAGFVLEALGHLPEVGEVFDAHGWRFEVVDLDGRRIDKIIASPPRTLRRAAR